MSLYTPSSPHMHANTSIAQVMSKVLLALLPGIAAYVWLFGWGIVVQLSFATLLALAAEALMLRLRRRPLLPFLSDGSAIVTAWLLCLSIPPIAPWWITAIGVLFAIVLAKHLYGGLGYNPFNPAMVGYAALLISFPAEMTAWQAPQALDLAQAASLIFLAPPREVLDAVTGATPMDFLKTQLGLDKTVDEVIGHGPLFGYLAGKTQEILNLMFLLGGLWLIRQRIIGWQIPAAMLASLATIAAVFHLYDPQQFASPAFHLASGAVMLGAFFIATDPVSASTTPRGRLIYGAGIGILIYVIRTWGGYPDGVAFAVLLLNICAPTIDYYTKPRVFGHGDKD